MSKILPSLLNIYSSEHSDTNATGRIDNPGLAHQGVVAHMQNASGTAYTLSGSPEHKQAAGIVKYMCASIRASGGRLYLLSDSRQDHGMGHH